VSQQPFISVITVSRNAAPTIGDCISSVCAQRGFGTIAEHLLVDGASSDDTCGIAERASSGRTRIVSEPDGGLYEAMNKGVHLAAGQVVGFLNADDLYAHERVLECVAAEFRAEPGLGLLHSGLCYVDRQDPTRVVRTWPAEEFDERALRLGDLPPHPSVFMDRQLFLRLGGFNLGYRIAADSDLLFRALLVERARHRAINDCWVRMRLGGVSNRSWRNVLQSSSELRRSMRAAGMGNPWFLLARRYARKLAQYRRRR